MWCKAADMAQNRLDTNVYVWCYTVLVVHATWMNEWMNDHTFTAAWLRGTVSLSVLLHVQLYRAALTSTCLMGFFQELYHSMGGTSNTSILANPTTNTVTLLSNTPTVFRLTMTVVAISHSHSLKGQTPVNCSQSDWEINLKACLPEILTHIMLRPGCNSKPCLSQ